MICTSCKKDLDKKMFGKRGLLSNRICKPCIKEKNIKYKSERKERLSDYF